VHTHLLSISLHTFLALAQLGHIFVLRTGSTKSLFAVHLINKKYKHLFPQLFAYPFQHALLKHTFVLRTGSTRSCVIMSMDIIVDLKRNTAQSACR